HQAWPPLLSQLEVVGVDYAVPILRAGHRECDPKPDRHHIDEVGHVEGVLNWEVSKLGPGLERNFLLLFADKQTFVLGFEHHLRGHCGARRTRRTVEVDPTETRASRWTDDGSDRRRKVEEHLATLRRSIARDHVDAHREVALVAIGMALLNLEAAEGAAEG